MRLSSLHGFVIVICTGPVLLTVGNRAKEPVTMISKGPVRLRSSEYTSKVVERTSNSTFSPELDPVNGMLDPSAYVATC